MKIKPNVIEQVDKFCLGQDQIEELIRAGFMADQFLGGRPGDAQRVEFSFDLGHHPTATIVVKTLVQEYKDNP